MESKRKNTAEDWRARVEELAKAASMQAQVSNRAWLALTTVALLAVLPQVASRNGTVSLPFGLGQVTEYWFHIVVFAILIVLAIFFAAAHAQQMRAQVLAQSVIDHLETFDDYVFMRPRELFDLLRLPSLNRVAPLAQLLTVSKETSVRKPIWLRLVSVSYYGSAKLMSQVVYFCLPAGVLLYLAYTVSIPGFSGWVLKAGALIALSSLALVLVADTWYSVTILKFLWK